MPIFSFNRNLLALLQTNPTPIEGLSSSKELRNILHQLRAISNGENNNTDHNEFLRVYEKNVIKEIHLIEKLWVYLGYSSCQ